jgi:hypothetical protein
MTAVLKSLPRRYETARPRNAKLARSVVAHGRPGASGAAIRFRNCRSRLSLTGHQVLASLAIVLTAVSAVRADVTIGSAVTTGQQGDGGTFTVTATGSINTTEDNGIRAATGSAITTLTVEGPVTAKKTGVLNDGQAITTLTNSSTITGTDDHGIFVVSSGTITTLSNDGTLFGGQRGIYAKDSNTVIGTITNTGLINGTREAGVQLDTGATVTTLINSGTIRGDRGVWQNTLSADNPGQLTTLENLSGGLISGDVQWGYENNGYTGTITNHDNATIYGLRAGIVGFEADLLDLVDNKAGGTIEGGENGTGIILFNTSRIKSVENAGTITSGQQGIYAEFGTSLIDSLTNSGTINGTNFAGIRVGGNGAKVETITNSGIIQGSRGIYMDGGTITTLDNQAGGSINSTGSGGNRDGVTTYGTITTLTNAGSITGATHGVYLEFSANALIDTLTNSGTITGAGEGGIRVGGNGARVATLTNTGSIGGSRGIFVNGGGTITTLDNQTVEGVTGVISGNGDAVDNAGTIVTLTNGGTISGNEGIRNGSGGTITTLTNNATITATNSGILTFGSIPSLTNAGSITGGQRGIYVEFNSNALISSLTNSGTITGAGEGGISVGGNGARVATLTNTGSIGGSRGIFVNGGGTITTLDNQTVEGVTGVISGNGDAVDNAGTIVTLTNGGTISGNEGIRNGSGGTITTLTNNATITATNSGILTFGSIPSLTNAGSITGGQRGIYVEFNSNALISSLTNSGTITGTGFAGIQVGGNGATLTSATNTGTIQGSSGIVTEGGGLFGKLTNSGTIAGTSGVAIGVRQNGVLGDASGAGGVAIESTGIGAAINGSIANRGTIHHGFTIANQNVTVSGDGGTTGTFSNGLLNVTDGNLTFTNGRTFLGADVAVNGGSGTVFNEGIVAFGRELNFDGLFSQSSGGTLSTLVASTTNFGSIVFTGAAAFEGTLDLDLVGGFNFAAGQSYLLFTFDSYTADFFGGLSVDGQGLTSAGTDRWNYNDLILQEVWTPTTMSLSILPVPEPSTLVLGAAGIAPVAWRAYRRRKRA